jgi:fructose-1,6-bisphosphatase/sedoheptulose 1,7-bisphosphatase-like protein
MTIESQFSAKLPGRFGVRPSKSTSIAVEPHLRMERILTLGVARVTERATVARHGCAGDEARGRRTARLSMPKATASLPKLELPRGSMLRGGRFCGEFIETDTVAMCPKTGTLRRIAARHRRSGKVRLA